MLITVSVRKGVHYIYRLFKYMRHSAKTETHIIFNYKKSLCQAENSEQFEMLLERPS